MVACALGFREREVLFCWTRCSLYQVLAYIEVSSKTRLLELPIRSVSAVTLNSLTHVELLWIGARQIVCRGICYCY